MSSADDIRARLDAQIAVRRAADAQERSALRLAHTGHRRGGRAQDTITSSLIRLVVILAAAASFAFGLRAYVVQPFWIPSQSMEPTLHGCPTCEPDRLLVDKLSYRLHGVNRGDVVVFRRPPQAPPTDPTWSSGLSGLPGESSALRTASVSVDNHPLKEPYVAPDCHGTQDFGPTDRAEG